MGPLVREKAQPECRLVSYIRSGFWFRDGVSHTARVLSGSGSSNRVCCCCAARERVQTRRQRPLRGEASCMRAIRSDLALTDPRAASYTRDKVTCGPHTALYKAPRDNQGQRVAIYKGSRARVRNILGALL